MESSTATAPFDPSATMPGNDDANAEVLAPCMKSIHEDNEDSMDVAEPCTEDDGDSEDHEGSSLVEDSVSSPPPNGSMRTTGSISHSVSSEDDFRCSLNDLQKLIDICVDTERGGSEKEREVETGNIFARLHLSASKVHRSLMAYGNSIELGLRPDTLEGTIAEESASDQSISDSTRENLRGIGKKLWMTIRSNPSVFHDRVNQNETTAQAMDFSATEQGSLQSQESADKDKAAASGYIRAIAARLVLIDSMQTKGIDIPKLIMSPPVEDVVMSESSMEEDEDRRGSIPTASIRELEFGIKCFGRSGRAVLAFGDEPMAAFVLLKLAISLWQGMAAISESSRRTDEVVKNLDEAFDAFVLLPDAASLVGSTKLQIAKRVTSTTDNKEETSHTIGSPVDILSYLEAMEEFVLKHCLNIDGRTDSPTPRSATMLAIQRYLPSLARSSLKHGNSFVRNKQYSLAKTALRIALGTTDRCLAYIRSEQSEKGSNSASSTAIQIRKQDMLVISKECFYVLSYIEEAFGKKEEAQKCLDRLEKHIDQQSQLDKGLYESTMKELNGRHVDRDSRLGVSVIEALAVEGPKQQDFADIAARAQAAHAKAIFSEAKERANLAFSRIMIDQGNPSPTDDEEKRIDFRLKELANLSLKLLGTDGENYNPTKTQEPDMSSNEYAALKLALMAASRILVRRLLAAAWKGDVDVFGHPYPTLLTTYGDEHPMHIFVVIDQLKSLLICIQTAYDQTHQLPKNVLSALNKSCIEVGKNLISKLRLSVEKQKSQESPLFPKSNSGGRLSVREANAQFARAVSFYRDRSEHKLCAEWADILLQVLQENPDETPGTEQAIADILGVKAYSLCMMNADNNHVFALKTAREAWQKGPTLNNLAVLFHCGVIADSKNETTDALLELDSALSRLSSELPSPLSDAQILRVFPVLSTSCSDLPNNGGLLFGIQTRWIDKFVEVEDHFEGDDSLLEVSFFCLVRAYLRNIELLWDKWKCRNDVSSFKQSERNLDRSLDKVLALVLRMRDLRRSRDSAASTLLWHDEAMRKVVGEQKDCVWIAEQLWNLALVSNLSSEVSSELFAKAHDFALLSEEELGGSSLTKGHLDCEMELCRLDDDAETFSSHVSAERRRVASELSSEFSFQCLFLAVSRVVDNRTHEEPSLNETNSYHRQVRQSLLRLLMAKREFAVALPSGDEQSDDSAETVTAWLELQCLCEIGDDSLCSQILREDDLLPRLSMLESLAKPGSADTGNDSTLDSEMQTDGTTSNSPTGTSHQTTSPCSMIGNVYLTSLCAQSKNMPESEKLLLQHCVNEMIQSGASSINTIGRVHTLGEMQRDLICVATRMEDVTAVFDCVDSALKSYTKTNCEKDNPLCYSTSELDWFAIESYNRGLRLFLLGDLFNAEKLLVIALNILGHCSTQAQSYGTDMRRAYSNLVEHTFKEGSNSDSRALVMNLFGSNTAM